MSALTRMYTDALKRTGSSKKARREMRQRIARAVNPRGLSPYLRARSTNGRLKLYAKKIAQNAVAAFRSDVEGGVQ